MSENLHQSHLSLPFQALVLGAVFSSLVLFFKVLAAALLAWLIFKEPLSVWQPGGGPLILAGIFAARPRKLQKRS